MRTHKTLAGMLKAAENLAADLIANPPADDREYRAASRKVDGLVRELSSLWSNPTDVTDAAQAKQTLLAAWDAVN